MTTLKFLCPSGHRLKAALQDSGRHVQCSTCGHEVIVPFPESLEVSELQKEDSETFVSVSIDRGSEIVSTPAEPLPPPPSSAGIPVEEKTPCVTERRPNTSPRRVHVYRYDERRFESLKRLTLFLGFLVALSVAPVVPYVGLFTSAAWPRSVLIVAVLQSCYLAWMLSAPDWSTIRVVMIVFGVTAMIYAAVMAWIALTPPDEPLRFGLEEVRPRAMQWCGCVLTLMLFGAYLCARTSGDWRRAMDREMA